MRVTGKTLEMIGGVGNSCSIPKGGFVGGREIRSDGLGQVADSLGPKTS